MTTAYEITYDMNGQRYVEPRYSLADVAWAAGVIEGNGGHYLGHRVTDAPRRGTVAKA